MSKWQKLYIKYVNDHPGCCIADVNRAYKYNPNAGHKWVYDGIKRLINRNILFFIAKGNKKHLFLNYEFHNLRN